MTKNGQEIIVPSDVTLVERKLSTGWRKPSLLESLGLATVFPLYRRNWVRNNRKDLKAILTRTYDEPDATTPSADRELLEIVLNRQRHVRRMIICRAAGLMGAVVAPLGTWYSFRHYDMKGQVAPLPFALYGGNLVARAFAGWFTGRWASPLREVSLGNLPAHRFLSEDEE
eukprot:Protomagalhaensia_wolfi_Nauph_80__1808@NODE_2129_length_1204_cov_63_062661_g1665_i0_p1_GENE_NODE_2129_length_1204_cov_63_062661_g1665_i0NODE_2129_length_1204_cov_63_062661_g1665_i0_p1_ORF_typecomplete_len184_score34_67_NODE_2129_length_1204_cov_63_062661_g1665_i06521164